MRTPITVAIASITLGLAGLVIWPVGAAINGVTITASRSNLSDAGGSVTIRATVRGGKTCTWTSKPKVKGFDGSVVCKASLSRVAKLPTNTTMCVKQFTFSLDTVSGSVKASGSTVVKEAGTMNMVCAR